jgi:hypothetical protein
VVQAQALNFEGEWPTADDLPEKEAIRFALSLNASELTKCPTSYGVRQPLPRRRMHSLYDFSAQCSSQIWTASQFVLRSRKRCPPSPKISAFPVRRTGVSAWSGKFLKIGMISVGLLDSGSRRAEFGSRVKIITHR